MPATMYGADADQLDQLAQAVKAAADDIESQRQGIGALLRSIKWIGPIAEAFDGEWTANGNARMVESAEFLKSAATDLNRQAADQRAASQANGGLGPGIGVPPFAREPEASEPPVDKGDENFTYEEYGPPDYQLFDESGNPKITDIQQGRLGDCWLLATLGSTALVSPEWIKDHIVANPDGTYTVTLYEEANFMWWRYYDEVKVTVDATFPSDGPGDPIYAKAPDDAVWVMVMEKAMAKHFGGYGELNGDSPGKALEAIFGQDFHSVKNYEPRYEEVALRPGSIVLSSGGDKTVQTDNGIFSNHTYTVQSVDREAGTVTLYNPHGPGTSRTVPIADFAEMFPRTYEAS